jgi:hypothetical protein
MDFGRTFVVLDPDGHRKGAGILNQALPTVEKADIEFFNPLTKHEGDSLTNLFQKLMSQRSID